MRREKSHLSEEERREEEERLLDRKEDGYIAGPLP
jgi:hypothetical protein